MLLKVHVSNVFTNIVKHVYLIIILNVVLFEITFKVNIF